MPDQSYTITGNLTEDPSLRFLSNGTAVANVTIAYTPRKLNKQTNEWEDGDALFMRGSLWRGAAENAAESLTRGQRVIATGTLKQTSYEAKDGSKRTSIEMDIDDIGPSLKYATAKVTRNERKGGGSYQSSAPAPAFAGGDDQPPF